MHQTRFPMFAGMCLTLATYLFLYLPIIVLIIFSFNQEQFLAQWTGFTWNWYQELFNASHVWAAVGNSLIVACSATCLSIGLSITFLFYCMSQAHIARFVYLFYINLIVPEIVLAIGLLSFFVFCSIPLGLLTLIAAHTVLGLGYAVPIVYARFVSIDKAIIESSLDLGATTTQTFMKIVVPLLSSSLVTAGLLIFIISFDDFVLAYFCTGSSAQTLPLYILAMLRSGISPVINALSTILLCISALFVFLFCSLRARSRIV